MSLDSHSLIRERFRPNLIQQQALDKLGLKTLADLLRYFPTRYGAAGVARKIAELKVGDEAIIYAKVLKNQTKKAWHKKIPMAEAVVEDETGKIKIIWFHQAYLAKKAPAGTTAYFRGKVTARPAKGGQEGELYLANPEIDSAGLPAKKVAAGDSLFTNQESETPTPVYPETRGLSSGWFHHHLKTILSEGAHENLEDPLPADLLQKYNLPKLTTALVWIHTPRRQADAEAARKRFAFEEIFFIQLARLRDRTTYRAQGATKIEVAENKINEFVGRFPFTPTKAQGRVIKQILADLKRDEPMTRLLEGDVGSGKTAVAATTAYAAVMAGAEVAYMAPTEILARQHFESFIGYFKNLNVAVGLITGSGCYKFPSKIISGPSTALGVNYTSISRPQLLKWVANGEIPILIGTHALIQKTLKWKNLGLVIIDEQHRFGVMQRSKLAKKNESSVYPAKGGAPHLLSMTATPIPRTLALTIYGDLDLSLLDELPAGRKNIITQIVPPSEAERVKVYQALRQELITGRQAYVICPRIDEPDPTKAMALQAKSAKAEQKRLGEKIFPEFMVGLVHSKMKPTDKEAVMADFTAGKIDILVATSVVEVGVNVPNATSIIIEGAERFGLAQLHQLRGRVFRSSHQAYCYLFTDTKTAKSLDRLKALERAKNGFELAEMDLALRGAGLLSGEKQWGISDLGMEAIKNIKMVEAARESAQKVINHLDRYPQTKTALGQRAGTVLHFE